MTTFTQFPTKFSRLLNGLGRRFSYSVNEFLQYIYYRKLQFLSRFFRRPRSRNHLRNIKSLQDIGVDTLAPGDFSQKIRLLSWPANDLNIDNITKLGIYHESPGYALLTKTLYLPNRIGLYSTDGIAIDKSQTYRGQGKHEKLGNQPKQCCVPKEAKLDHRLFIYMGPLFGHFGHFLTESISRLWYTVENKDDYYLLFHGEKRLLDLAHIKSFFGLLGVNSNRLVIHDVPTRLANVVIPYASISNRAEIFFAHKKSPELVASNHFGDRRINPSSQPLYLSRIQLNSGKSKYLGEGKLLNYLEKKNVRIVSPQTLSLSEQIELFNRHETIIGAQGSAFHNVLFSLDPKILLYLCSSVGSNYFMIDAIKNNRAMYAQCVNQMPRIPLTKITPKKKFKRYYFIDWDKAVDAIRELGI